MISLHPEGNFGVVLPSDPLEHFRHSGGRYGSRPRQSGLEGGSIVTVTVAEILVIIVQLVVDQTKVSWSCIAHTNLWVMHANQQSVYLYVDLCFRLSSPVLGSRHTDYS